MALEVYKTPASVAFEIILHHDDQQEIGNLKVHQNALIPEPLYSLPSWGVSSSPCPFFNWIRSSDSIVSLHQPHQDLFQRCTRSNNRCCKE
jgi:hypothetical protein